MNGTFSTLDVDMPTYTPGPDFSTSQRIPQAKRPTAGGMEIMLGNAMGDFGSLEEGLSGFGDGEYGDDGMGFLRGIRRKIGGIFKKKAPVPRPVARAVPRIAAPRVTVPSIARPKLTLPQAIPVAAAGAMAAKLIASARPQAPAPTPVLPASGLESPKPVPTTTQVVTKQAQIIAPSDVKVIKAEFNPYVHPMAMLRENAAMSGLFDDIKSGLSTAVKTGVQQARTALTSGAATALATGTQKILGSQAVQESLAKTGQQAATTAVAEKLLAAQESAKQAALTGISFFEKNKKMILIGGVGLAAAYFLLMRKKRAA